MSLIGGDGRENRQSLASSWLQEGIRLLPPEILIHIFILATPPEFSSCCTRGYYPSFLSVCKTWRELTVTTPEIWSYIRTGYDRSLLSQVYENSPSKAQLSFNIELWLSRSVMAPLHVAIDSREADSDWSFLFDHMPRWRRVQCSSEVYNRIYELHAVHSSADRLVHLEIDQSSPYGELNLSYIPLSFTAIVFPSLVYLHIKCLDSKWPFPLAPRLRVLSLAECNLTSNTLHLITNRSPLIEILRVPPNVDVLNVFPVDVKSLDRLWSCHYACNSGVLNFGFLKFARNLTHLEFGLFSSPEMYKPVLPSVINLTLGTESLRHSGPVTADEVLNICPNVRSLTVRSIVGKSDNQYSFLTSGRLLASLSKCQEQVCAPHLTELSLENLPVSREDLKQFAENRMDPSRNVLAGDKKCTHFHPSTPCSASQETVRLTLSDCYACPEVQSVNYHELIAAFDAMKPIWSHLVGGQQGGDPTDIRIARGEFSETGAVCHRYKRWQR